MIKYVCPACGFKFRRVVAVVGFETKLNVCIVPTANGVAVGVESSPHMKLGGVVIKQMKCPECGNEIPRAPKYAIICGNCGTDLGEADDPREATERYCKDSHRIYCPKCWRELVSRFCEVCQYAATCSALRINRR